MTLRIDAVLAPLIATGVDDITALLQGKGQVIIAAAVAVNSGSDRSLRRYKIGIVAAKSASLLQNQRRCYEISVAAAISKNTQEKGADHFPLVNLPFTCALMRRRHVQQRRSGIGQRLCSSGIVVRQVVPYIILL